MAISDTITSMYENVGNVYDVLELAGADLTNVDKNIENLKQSWEERLLYFLANGTDVVWNNWLPKVTGSGESITLNNTIEAKMDFVYKGNTSQETTTGKNLLPLNIISSQTSGSLTITNLGDGTLKLNGTNSNQYIDISYNYELQANVEYKWINLNTLSGSDGNVSFRDNSNNSITYTGLANASNTYTPTSNKQVAKMRLFFGTTTFNNYIVKIMLIKSTDTETWEPYTNGPSPNPDYPQDIQVVSGDNTIKVEGKNLLDKDSVVSGFVNADGTIGGDTNAYRTSNFIPIQPNTAYYKTRTDSPRTKYYDSNKQPLNTTTYQDISIGGNEGTFTTPNNACYLRFSYPVASVDANNIMVHKGTTSTSYEPYQSQTYPINLGNIELCKIGNYQDVIKRSSGKNLYGTAIKTDSTTGSSYTIITDTSDKLEIQGISSYYSGINKKYQLQPNTQYTISLKYSELGSKSKARIYYKLGNDCENITVNDNNGYIDIGTTRTSLTFTTDSTGLVVIMFMCNFDTNSGYVVYNDIQLEKGNSSSDYEPYGKVWYLNKQTGKVVLNGSEDWTKGSQTNVSVFVLSNVIYPQVYGENGVGLSNRFKYEYVNNANAFYFGWSNNVVIVMPNTYTLESFKTWLSSNNTSVYYITTPTTTEITDTTLINQLETIKKSYNTQTSISQVNNDKPFILDVVALGELS